MRTHFMHLADESRSTPVTIAWSPPLLRLLYNMRTKRLFIGKVDQRKHTKESCSLLLKALM